MTVLGIDPGDTVGLSLWDDNGLHLKSWELSYEEYLSWLATGVRAFTDWDYDGPLHYLQDVTHVVLENWVLRPRSGNLNAKGNKLKASQAIGATKLIVEVFDISLSVQEPAILKIAAMHSRTPIVSHFADKVAAYLHVWWFFENEGNIDGTRLREKNGIE